MACKKTASAMRWRICPRCGYRVPGYRGMTHQTKDHERVEMVAYIGPEPPGKTLDDMAAEAARYGRRLRGIEPLPPGGDDVSMLLACASITLFQLRAYTGPEQERARLLEQDLAAAYQLFGRRG